MPMITRHLVYSGIAAVLMGGTAQAQLIGGLPLPQLPLPVTREIPIAGPVLNGVLHSAEGQSATRPTLDTVGGLPTRVAQAGAPTLLELRRLRLRELIREHRMQLERDSAGQPVRRGVLLVIDPDAASLQVAAQAGFRVLANEMDPELGLRSVHLAVPDRLDVREALKRLRRAAPKLQADYDHIFEPAGGALMPVHAALAAAAAGPGGRAIGMIDGGVASHPALAAAAIEQSGFAGPPKPTGHGTAVASLLVGHQGAFRGAATGVRLYVADVYGGSRAAGSASAIAKALGWLASRRPQVINISLIGPSNALVQRAIQIVQARGIQVVAAVGNDGPAAPPQYPASYPGVNAITAVDARGRALPEAGRAAHLDFAAPGADMAAALPGQGYVRVRGTSFAAPLAAARLLRAGSPERLAAEAIRGTGRVGRGIVCANCRVDPRIVAAK